MKVLWFTGIPMPEMLNIGKLEHRRSGGWMVALLDRLNLVPEMEVYVACAAPGLSSKDTLKVENNRSYPIRQGPARRLFVFSNLDNNPRYLAKCVEIVNIVKPDIIHIHGSESFYGLLGSRDLVYPPIVISLQGLLHICSNQRHYFGFTSLWDVLMSHRLRHLIRGSSPFIRFYNDQRSAIREIEILKGNRWFMGRTLWDRAHLDTVNPHARYFHVPELLRSSFYGASWDISRCRKHRIIFTNANTFRRGTEILIDAVAILKREFPDVSLALVGGVLLQPYGKRLLRRVHELGLESVVEFIGYLNEEEMTHELLKAHVFAIPSLIENSPNSLCEAQLIGLPCVASYVGGIPSLIEEGQTGLLFPAGDASVLAMRIREFFVDDNLGREIGFRAKLMAQVRHDPETVTNIVIETYKTIIREFGEIRT